MRVVSSARGGDPRLSTILRDSAVSPPPVDLGWSPATDASPSLRTSPGEPIDRELQPDRRSALAVARREAYVHAMTQIREGLLGSWDRLVGPGASARENVGTVVSAVVGRVVASRSGSQDQGRRRRATSLILEAMAIDLWGGAWCNNTLAATRWYHRDGHGPSDRLRFARAHLHPFVLAWMDVEGGSTRDRWLWACAVYGYLMAAVPFVERGNRERRGLFATIGGVAVDVRLGPSPTAPWFGPIYFVKLLAGHVGGARLAASFTGDRRADAGDDDHTGEAVKVQHPSPTNGENGRS